MKFNKASDIIRYMEEENLDLVEYALIHEYELSGKTRDEIESYLANVWTVMKEAIAKGLDPEQSTKGKIIGNESIKLMVKDNKKKAVSGKTMRKAIAYALAMMEVNASMGKIVASPTAGSCGVLPAVLLTIQERFDLDDDTIIKGLMVANLTGELIAHSATLAGAEGGCQAEVGSASAMASAAVAYMLEGTANQVFDAAAICFKNLMGLVCDPIAGLVESPCAKRNTIGAANALISAEMTLAGIPSIVPFDEVVEAMYRVGKSLPVTLRETSRGGVAITPTGESCQNRIFGGCTSCRN
ncbi:L-serine ammonia-lyase, iron-sulfur-dependent, subunit alpha [Clostridia bacterium]|nr:L-serine ammonia-lyase, iron-sulfur-dependent, subunit alpha [Clostridia bacterium]